MRIKNLIFIAGLQALLSGCVGFQIIPPQHVVREIKRVRLVALEPPPLEVPSQMHVFDLFPPQLPHVFFAISMVADIVVLYQVPAATKEWAGPLGQESELRSKVLNNQGLWEPTLELCKEVEKQLSSERRSVVISPKIQPIPGITDRSYTYFGENWMAPIREWYNAEQSNYDYVTHQASGNEMILEVALINYSMGIEDHLMLQVMLKLVDPLTGKTLGRARAWANPQLSANSAFEDNGKLFKQVFSEKGSDLVHQCLKTLGLL